jgi:predicted acyl esterase
MSETRAAVTGRRTIHFPDDQVLVVKDLQIPMSDGVALAGDLYLPDGPDERGPDHPLPVAIEYVG